MLIISRLVGETLIIDDNIRVTVVTTSCDKYTQIGIDAPKEIPIKREEIFDGSKRRTPGST